MRHEHENARRHAYNTLAEANRHLDRGNIRNPKHHQMLTAMVKDATETLRNLDDMDDVRPYSDTSIGYNADMRRRRYAHDDTSDTIRRAMDVINKILPHVTGDFENDADMRQGVPGTGPYANPRLRRRGGRKGIGRRRYEMDDRYDVDDRYDDDRYDDDRYDVDRYDVDDARRGRRRDKHGRFMDTDDRYDDVRRTADDARRTADEARRIADDARRTADDTRNVTPVMTHTTNRYTDIKNDARTHNEDTNDMHRPGPDMRR